MRALGTLWLTALAVGLCFVPARADRVQGNWEGGFTTPNLSGQPVNARIIAEGGNVYRALLEARAEGRTYNVELRGQGDGRVAVFIGKAGEDNDSPVVTAEAINGRMTGKVIGMGEDIAFALERVTKKPPTLGQPAPEGAIVLFDGQNQDGWEAVPPKWNLSNGQMEVSGSSLMTKDEFGAGLYHIEFKTPLMPHERGQGRGNSGVYLLGRYEVQVLDSFGLPPADNEAGGIYQAAVPRVNASLPPEEWQTYDITFTPARFDESGKKVENARIRVEHNGILIHDNVELSKPTPGGVSDQDAPTGPLLLQNHGDRVAYRNIWFAPASE